MMSPDLPASPRHAPARRIALVAAAPAALALLVACGGPAADAPPAAPRDPLAVRTLAAAPTTVARTFEATGTVLPRTSVSPGTKILGRVDEVPVREGDRVERGALLARLESRDLEAAVREAEAGVAMARARLENARTQHARIEALHARGSATTKSLEDTVAGLAVAAAGLQQAEAGLASARVLHGYAEIRSPLGGWVVAKRIEPGDMATPGAPLFTVEDLSEVEVRVEVPESEIEGLAPGQQATLEVLGTRRTAAIDRILPSADPGSRTFDVRFVLPNEDGRVRSGMFVRAVFSGRGREVLVAPESTLVRRGGLVGVYLVEEAGDGPRARLHWIETGRAIDPPGGGATGVEVLAGLEPGDLLVVEPPAGLADGAPLEVRP